VKHLRDDSRRLNMASARMTQLFRRDGFRSCILKGQANALMYPDPLLRTAGDVDIWVDGLRPDVTKYVLAHRPQAEINYHHIEFEMGGVPVEVHYTPSFCGNLFFDRRLQRYFSEVRSAQMENLVDLPEGVGQISTLDDGVNRVFQLTHVMHHFFFEGIGFRHFTDYYYLLRSGFTAEEREHDMKLLSYFGMTRFTRAVMYVMREVYGLDGEQLLCEPHEPTGRMLLAEALEAGNFGHHDERYHFAGTSRVGQYLMEVRRNLRFARWFPGEAIFGRPIWRVWHQFEKRRIVREAMNDK